MTTEGRENDLVSCCRQHVEEGEMMQPNMEEFFHNDDFFVLATPGFFTMAPLVTASG